MKIPLSQIGRGIRIATVLAAALLVIWLIDRNLVFGSRLVVTADDFLSERPIIQSLYPDGLLAYRDEAGTVWFRLGRERVPLRIKPPRTFQRFTIMIDQKNADVPALGLIVPSTARSTVSSTLFWYPFLDMLPWAKIEDGGWTLRVRPGSATVSSVDSFFDSAQNLSGVASIAVDPPIGHSVKPLREEDLNDVNYLIYPTPQFSQARRGGEVAASGDLKNVLNKKGEYLFTLYAPGMVDARTSIDVRRVTVTLEGSSLLSRLIRNVRQLW